MATNQGDRQASVRAITGTAWTYEGDWHALFDRDSIAAGTFNGRLLAWINAKLSSSYTNVNDAMFAFASSKGATSWNGLGTFSILGPELVPDPTFSTSTGWTLETGWSITGGKLIGSGVSSTYAILTPLSPLVNGVTYRISWTSVVTTLDINIVTGPFASFLTIHQTPGVTSYSADLVAAAPDFRFQGGGDYNIDDLSVRAVL